MIFFIYFFILLSSRDVFSIASRRDETGFGLLCGCGVVWCGVVWCGVVGCGGIMHREAGSSGLQLLDAGRHMAKQRLLMEPFVSSLIYGLTSLYIYLSVSVY